MMGLIYASQHFQQLMEDRLQTVRDVADPYIDDIIVGTWVGPDEDVFEAHDCDIRRVLELLKKDEFTIGKWQLFVPELDFCGHILGGVTRRPDPGNLRVIKKWEIPQTVTGLRAFLWFTKYYTCYAKNVLK